jgi:hypothetical protein
VNTVEMMARRKTIRDKVDACHHAAIVFKTAYSIIMSPKFAANKQMLKTKSNGKGLAKGWKSPISAMRHAECRVKLIHKAGILGKAVVGLTEACSTMKCPFCPTLWHPGVNWVHHCPKPECKRIAVRDECGRGISNFSDARVLIKRKEDKDRWAKQVDDIEVEQEGGVVGDQTENRQTSGAQHPLPTTAISD